MPELTVIETLFTPWQSLAGGVLIGLASVLLMLTLGRVMGATGVLASVLTPSAHPDVCWRLALLAGMISGPLIVLAVTGQMPAVEVPASMPMLLAGGLLVGIGVTYGSGCTSGHGVCGMARLSRRSIAATATFMLTTGLTVFVIRHVLGA
ncbi:YeeE/YedE family protein [Nitrobacter sp.]|uniref:YeeE/YedE family protein n=1 Tax=unclassified Nitrobacter TaxID=2620411 RepID=UPI0032206483